MDDKLVSAEPLKTIEGGPTADGKAIVIHLTGQSGGEFTFGTDTDTVSQLVTLLLCSAEDAAQHYSPAIPRETEAVPITVTDFGWAAGRSPEESNLILQVGLVRLVFAVETSKLHKFASALTGGNDAPNTPRH